MQFLQAIKGAGFCPFVVMRSAIGWSAFITGMAGIIDTVVDSKDICPPLRIMTLNASLVAAWSSFIATPCRSVWFGVSR